MPPTTSYLGTLSQLQIMALTVYGEARGETSLGRDAVAWVIFNRSNKPSWWGSDIKSVCLAPYQFSCWNKDDPNYKRLIDPITLSDRTYKTIQDACNLIINGKGIDPTHGSTHYCVTSIIDKTKWTKTAEKTVVIGSHTFFRTS